MADFDFAGAKAAGYSDEEILQHVSGSYNFDVQGALQAGYSPAEVIQHLSQGSGSYASGSAPVVTSSPQVTNRGTQESNAKPIMGSPAASVAVGTFLDYPMGMAQQILAPPNYSQGGPDLGIDPSQAYTPIRDIATAGYDKITDFNEAMDRARESYGRGEGTDWWRIGGNVLGAIKGTQGQNKVNLNWKGKAKQAGVEGGVFAGLLPTESEADRGRNFVVGTGSGIGMQGLVSGLAQTPHLKNWIVKQARTVTMSQAEKTKQAMMSLLNDDELVMLNQYLNDGMTMREASAKLGNTGFAELVRVSENAVPEGVVGANREAASRVDDLYRSMMGADPAEQTGSRTIEGLERARRTRSNELYDIANEIDIKLDKDLLDATSGSYISDVQKTNSFKNFVTSKGFGADKTGYWDKVVKDLRSKINRMDAGEALAAEEELKRLVEVLSEKNPQYGEAVTSYAALSIPVDRAKLAEDMWSRTRHPEDATPGYTSGNRGVRTGVIDDLQTTQGQDRLARDVTRFGGADFNRTITGGTRPGSSVAEAAAREGVEEIPENISRVQELQNALTAQSNYANLASMGSASVDDAFRQLEANQAPGMLERSIVLYNALRSRLNKRSIASVTEHIGELGRSPEGRAEFARLYAVASPEEKQAMSFLAQTIGSTLSGVGRVAPTATAVTATGAN